MTQVKEASAANGRVRRMRLTGGEEQAARDAPHTLRHPAGRMLHTAGAARESRDARPAPHTRRDPRELRRSSGALRRLRPPAGTGAPGPRPLSQAPGPAPRPQRHRRPRTSQVNGSKSGSVPALPYLALVPGMESVNKD